MKFKTPKDSETGKKFEEIKNKLHISWEAVVKLTEEIGATEWRGSRWYIRSGISSLHFPKGFDVPKHFKYVKSLDGFMPNLTTKKGKELQKQIDALPKVSIGELNSCIGFDSMFKSIGAHFYNKEWFLFEVGDDWDVKIPYDCEEITTTEYNKLCK